VQLLRLNFRTVSDCWFNLNNVWSIYATILNDAENIVEATASGSPLFRCCQNLKVYTYQLAVDTWGSIPYSDTQK
jgi:hypothetical protein